MSTCNCASNFYLWGNIYANFGIIIPLQKSNPFCGDSHLEMGIHRLLNSRIWIRIWAHQNLKMCGKESSESWQQNVRMSKKKVFSEKIGSFPKILEILEATEFGRMLIRITLESH